MTMKEEQIPTSTIFKKVLLALLPYITGCKMHISMHFDISEMIVKLTFNMHVYSGVCFPSPLLSPTPSPESNKQAKSLSKSVSQLSE